MRRFQFDIQRFLRDHPEVSATRLGDAAVNDPCFVGDVLNKGRRPRADTMERVRAWMWSHHSAASQQDAVALPASPQDAAADATGTRPGRR
jgi:hypothetical protein